MLHFRNVIEGQAPVAIDNNALESIHKLARQKYPTPVTGYLLGSFESSGAPKVTAFEAVENFEALIAKIKGSPNAPILGIFRSTVNTVPVTKETDAEALRALRQYSKSLKVPPFVLVVEVMEHCVKSRHHRVFELVFNKLAPLPQIEITNRLMGTLDRPYKEGDSLEIRATLKYAADGTASWIIDSKNTAGFQGHTCEDGENVLKAIQGHFDTIDEAENCEHCYILPY